MLFDIKSNKKEINTVLTCATGLIKCAALDTLLRGWASTQIRGNIGSRLQKIK